MLLAYAKMALYDELLASDLPDDAYLLRDLVKYFPRPLRKRFRAQISEHRLRREITATLVANSLVNRGLGEFVGELSDRSGRPASSIARAYIVARDAFALVPLIGELEGLAGQIGAEHQVTLFGEVRQSLARGTYWFLRNLPAPINIRSAVDRFAPGIASLLDKLDLVLAEGDLHRFGKVIETYVGRGVEAGLARRIAGLPYLFPACEVVAVADEVGTEVVTAASTYFALDAQLRLGRLLEILEKTKPRNHWERLALIGLLEDLLQQHRRLTVQAFGSRRIGPQIEPGALQSTIAEWLSTDVTGFARWQRLLTDLDTQPTIDLAMLSVAVRSLSGLDAGEANAAA